MTNKQATGMGSLYVIATPIGNCDDITLRALNLLKTVDFILAEDTRHSMKLLNVLGIKNKLSSLHAHNEADKSQHVIDKLLAGQSVALISDAGTPLISDPGYPLVKLARQHDIPVVPIPGPCAAIAALSAAGLPCDSFLFVGFLPAKQAARKAKLASLHSSENTLVFYESTHRIVDCVLDLIEIYGPQTEVVLAKELTKTHERFISGTLTDVKNWLLADNGHPKGEFVFMIPPQVLQIDNQPDEALLSLLLAELPLKQAVNLASKLCKTNKNQLYEMALVLKNNRN